jgi:DNA-binding transcriptional LysR family regulator
MSLTEEGQRFLEAAQPSLQGLQQALLSVRQTREDIAGPLRISGPRTVLPLVVGPVVDEYIRLDPEVQPDLQFDDRIGNWVEERVDVGFRLGNAPQEGLIARRLFPLQLIICAAPSYLRKYGTPKSLYDLTTHRCSAFRRSDGRTVPWSVKLGDEFWFVDPISIGPQPRPPDWLVSGGHRSYELLPVESPMFIEASAPTRGQE